MLSNNSNDNDIFLIVKSIFDISIIDLIIRNNYKKLMKKAK